MYTYKFHWINGKIEISKGNNEIDAFENLGYEMEIVNNLSWVESIN